ncbi:MULTISPECIES: hypothetical protein [Helicobacter]|uniref:EF-hand domain-containing protein n=2 Tax=Helicobacter ganmani TaxID=60246 RepID=A0A3D8ICQ5_9HELI|nr:MULTISPECIES: hypothetical protein [Helicobacter]RDU62983.1 hypothetical protein CQA43_04985 [Helicobacter ganmani]
MQASFSLSSLQASYTTTQWSAVKEELTNNQANSVPQSTINQDAGGSTTSIVASNSLLGDRLGDFQKTILNRALSKISEIQDEMMKTWEQLFPSANNSTSSSQTTTITMSDLLYNKNFASQIIGSGISLSQGFSTSLEVSISGKIIGSDGIEKSLDLSISVSQSFMQNLQISSSNATKIPEDVNKKVIDPLVIDYEGSGTELSDTKMRFDLDSDGTPDQISTLKKGSGFLALDKNGDGKINDGSELFGTQSGDGFKDLSIYDSNNDGKIDKDDPIYDKLRIWTPDANGEGQLVGLGEKGIGVIYLNAQESQEMMRGENGDLLGIKQKTADYLREDGSSGQIHHIDLVSEKIKDEAVLNQATNDAILANGGQSISQILANKAYQGMGVSASNLSPNSIIPMFSALGNGITGLFERVPMASLTSLEVKVSFSLNSLQTANNGVSQEASKIWNAVEDNFKKMEEMKEKMESAFKRFDEFMQLNRLIFDPLKNKDNVFKSFNSNTLGKLLA